MEGVLILMQKCSTLFDVCRCTGCILKWYFDIQGSAWPLGFLMRHCSMLRNRMLADPSFLFKVGTEVSLIIWSYIFF